MDEEVTETMTEEEMLARHRQEKKELQATIQKLKKSVNKDKKKKKEVTEEIARLEKEQQENHAKELEALQSQKKQEDAVTNGVASLDLVEKASNDAIEDSVEEGAPEQGKKMSKAAKRRQKKTDENRAREARIREEKENNRFCARNVEAAKLKQLLKTRNLKMFEIEPNGDCMYAAMAHQMGEDTTVGWLRSQAGQYLRSHSDDFAPFITDPKTGDMLNPEQFEEYCNQIENTPAWGGQPELRALSLSIKRKIEVLQAEGTPIIFGEDCNDAKPLILTYYRHFYGLGEHYNSVVEATGDEEEQEET